MSLKEPVAFRYGFLFLNKELIIPIHVKNHVDINLIFDSTWKRLVTTAGYRGATSMKEKIQRSIFPKILFSVILQQ